MSNPSPPHFIREAHVSRVCQCQLNALGDHEILCGRLAVAHVCWTWGDPAKFSFVCEEHDRKVCMRFDYHQKHPMGPCCGMPGSLWIPAENTCRYDEEGLPTAEKVEQDLFV